MKEFLKNLRKKLYPAFGQRESDAMIRIIFRELKGWSPVDIVMNEDKPLSDFIKDKIDWIADRLIAGEPIQYIFNSAYFYGMDLYVDPSVLIPRPETEELVDMIVKQNTGKDLRVLDVGTGSGCIAIALYRNLLFPEIEAIDISPQAIAIAEKNAAKLNANINFIQADIFHIDLRQKKFDIIVSNPPYIGLSEKKDMESNVTDHEPHAALFVPDSDPTIYYKRITSVAADCLRPQGRIYYEVNPLHAGQVAEELADAGFSGISIIKDMYAKDRFVTAILDSNK